MIFKDRVEAGKMLSQRLDFLRGDQRLIVLGIPRGGVVVASEVAKTLAAPLDVLIVRKLGVPFHSELAFGAIDSWGNTVLEKNIIAHFNLSESEINQVREKERAEAERREKIFCQGKKELDLKDKTAVLVDDGMATGATAEAAVGYLKSKGVLRIILACPVAPPDTALRLKPLVDDLIVLDTPDHFMAVGQFYENFPQTSDEDVIRLLRESVE